VVIHAPEGGYARLKTGEETFVRSLILPEGFIQGAAGAGDAFCAGYLLGLHEAWPMEKRLALAVRAAAASLTHPTCTAGMRPLAELWKMG
jgi:sugar/nucleoside kinase (ribokinase family)